MSERFSLPVRLDSSGAAALVQALLACRGRPLQIDASGVEVIGARAIEVLVATAKQWALDAQPIALVAASDRFRATCTTLGLDPDAPWAPGAAPLRAGGAA